MFDIRRADTSLVQEFAAGVDQGEFASHAATLPILSQDLLASLWQKAIRRGDVSVASACAIQLSTRFPEYAWRRIRVIAMEDVGLANPRAVAMILAVANKASLVYRIGAARSLNHATVILAVSPKSRTACDLVSYRAAVSELGEACSSGADDGTDVDTALNDDAAWWERLDAARAICGHSERRRGSFVTLHRRDVAAQRDLVDKVCTSDDERYIILRGGSTHGLEAAICVALAMRILDNRQRRQMNVSSVEKCHGIPLYAACFYTALGRDAISSWADELSATTSAVQSWRVTNLRRALGMFVFQVEGSLLADSIVSVAAEQLRQESDRAELRASGVAEPHLRNFVETATRFHTRLNERRADLLSEFGKSGCES